MEYRVGSLADAISGSNDGPASKTRVVFVPKRDKPSKSSERIKLEEQNESPSKLLTPSKRKRKRKKMEVGNEVGRHKEEDNEPSSLKVEDSMPKFTSRELQRKHRTLKKKLIVNTRNRLMSKLLVGKTVAERAGDEQSRTILVKNLPNTMTPKQIKRRFKEFGSIETLRIRCAVPDDPKLRKREAVILKKFHPQRSNISAFICYKSIESVEHALKADEMEIDGHHIFISRVGDSKRKYSNKTAIFVGNLPWDTEEDDLYKKFIVCGKIVDITVIRDSRTGMSLGTAYVNYENNDGVELALMMDDVVLKDRHLRISRSDPKKGKKGVKQGQIRNKSTPPKKEKSKLVKKRKIRKNHGKEDTKVDSFGKKMASNYEVKPRGVSSQEYVSREKSSTQIPKSNFDFQGHSSGRVKKKKKMNKESLRKKALARILLSKKEK